jgi:hypothetical protein
MVDMLWLLISLTSLLVGAVAAWLTRETLGDRSLWLLILKWTPEIGPNVKV